MRFRRSFGVVLVLAVAAGLWTFFDPPIQSAAVQPDSASCVVTLTGIDSSPELPIHDLWEDLFQRFNSATLRPDEPLLDTTVRRRLRDNAQDALNRVAALRRSVAEQPAPGAKAEDGREREIFVAETLIDARDEAQRGLSAPEFAELDTHVQEVARNTTKQLPLTGRIQAHADRPALCELKVEGKEHPYLIPEYKLWEQYFLLYAQVGGLNRGADGEVTSQYVEVLRRHTFRMPAAEIRLFLDLSSAAAEDLGRLKAITPRRTPEEARVYDRALQHEVLAARHRLLIRLSRLGWREVLKELDKSRAGATWWYRSPYAG